MGKRKTGIMGGTFDPIHFGHLFIAECARHQFSLERVIFIPAGQPVHKSRQNILHPMHRLQMTKAAIESNPAFELSGVEIERSGPTFTVDTLEYLHTYYRGTDDFYFITGADAILDILTWKDYARVFELSSFIAVTRPGFSLQEMNRVLENLLPSQREKILFYETTGILISSTEIRERVKSRRPIRYLVPDKVEVYIRTHGLYQ